MKINSNVDLEDEDNKDKDKMKSYDKFLVAIVVGAGLLIVAAFAIMLLRPKAEYHSEDSPEGIAHNYLLAVQKGDYERAYGYLAPSLSGIPGDLEEFIENIEDRSWSFRLDTDATLQVESVRTTGDLAVVTIRETRFYASGIFDNYQETDTFKMDLSPYDSAWRITDSERYFARCWDVIGGCR